MARIKKTEYYLDIAKTVAQRSTCLRRRYGAIIVKNDEVISTGYNGAPRGEENCVDCGYCERDIRGIPKGERYELCVSVHAEANAIISASRRDMIGATIYIVGLEKDDSYANPAPCMMCRRLIVNAGIVRCIGMTSDGPEELPLAPPPRFADISVIAEPPVESPSDEETSEQEQESTDADEVISAGEKNEDADPGLSPYILLAKKERLASELTKGMLKTLGNGKHSIDGDRVSSTYTVACGRIKGTMNPDVSEQVRLTCIERKAGLPMSKYHFSIQVNDSILNWNHLSYNTISMFEYTLKDGLLKILSELEEGRLLGWDWTNNILKSKGRGKKPKKAASPYTVVTDPSMAVSMIENLNQSTQRIDWDHCGDKSFVLAVANGWNEDMVLPGNVTVTLTEQKNWNSGRNQRYVMLMQDCVEGGKHRRYPTEEYSEESLAKELARILDGLKKGAVPEPLFDIKKTVIGYF